MQSRFEFVLPENMYVDGKIVTFIITRLKPFEQFNLILKIISIIAKGAKESDKVKVEKSLHSILNTGKNFDDNISGDLLSLNMLLDAIKGALSSLSDNDRDWLVAELLKNVKIDCGNNYIVKATQEEIDQRISGYSGIFKLLIEIAKINLGFL